MRIQMYPAWLLVGALFTVAALVGGLYLSFDNRLEDGRWVAECLEKKSQAVLNRSPKLVILSGSNALFGFSARRLSEKYDIESVNAAVHAGLGIDYMLHYARRYFAPGRLFVLPLEYELYGKTSSEAVYQYQVIGFDPGYFLSLPLSQKLDFAMQLSIYDRARLLLARIFPYPRNDIDGFQSRTLNSWGDETKNENTDRKPAMLARLRAKRSAKYAINEAAWDELVAFARDADAAGSRVVLAYPNIYVKAIDFDLNRRFFVELEEKAAKRGIPIIGHPNDSVFNEEFAFDTIYHQNSLGQTVATDRLYKDLVETVGADNLRKPTSPANIPRS
jgi:hypothetical protein